MKRSGALLFAMALAAGAQPTIRKPVQPGKFVDVTGDRAALLGREDGTFEAWLMPVKVLDDFRLSVYFDGALEPVQLSELAETIEVSPGRVTITHSHAAFTIRQTWVAARNKPALISLLDIDTGRPLRLRASFHLAMRPMWPASFGGQTSGWLASEHALIAAEGLRRHYALIGSPLFSRSSELLGHQMPDGTLLLEMDVTPQAAHGRPIPIVIAGANNGREAAIKAYRETVAGISEIVREAGEHYLDFGRRTLRVETPDPVINNAFEWAKYAIDKGWQCDDGVGCGLTAGFGPSKQSERPGFGWFFGGDALMNSWSILDYGDPDRVRGVLEFLRDHQRADGKIPHEWTQSAGLLDWTNYPYAYYHGDTTPLYLFTAERYVARTGDLDFARRLWPSIQKAYRVVTAAADTDGLLSNEKAGAGAVETGALSGKVAKDIYLQGAWLAALEAYARMADRMAASGEAEDARRRLAKGRETLNGWFNADGFLPFGKLTDGSTYQALSAWQSFALAHGGLDEAKARKAASTLNRPEVSSDWGTRLFATTAPSYDPLSYNDGSVWPFVNGFATFAEYRLHRASGGLQHLHAAAALTGFSGAGFIAEYFSGDRCQMLPITVPHQLFSSSAVIHPLVSGLLGLEGDGLAGKLRFAPHLPPDWGFVRFEGYRVGKSLVSGEVSRNGDLLRMRVKVDGEAMNVVFSPAFAAGTRVVEPAAAKVELSDTDLHAALEFPKTAEAAAEFRVRQGVELIPDLAAAWPGDRSKAVRLVGSDVAEGRIVLRVAGPAGSTREVKVVRGTEWEPETGLKVSFPAGEEGAFTEAQIAFRRR